MPNALRENSFSHMSFINAIEDSTKDFINAPDEMQTQTLTPSRIVNYHIRQVYVFYTWHFHILHRQFYETWEF